MRHDDEAPAAIARDLGPGDTDWEYLVADSWFENIHTFNALYSYGYRNVYELGPLIDISKAKIEFEGSLLALGSWPAAGEAATQR